MSATSPAEVLLAPLDRGRGRLLRLLAPWLRPFVRDRSWRVAAVGGSIVILSLLGAVLGPLWLLAWGPLLLGVPHLVSDGRYLVVRPGLHRRGALTALVGTLVLVAGTGMAAGVGPLTLLVVAWFARARPVARVLVGLLGLTWAALEASSPVLVQLAFVHLHNVIAIAAWMLWWRRRDAGRIAVLVLLGMATGWLLLADAPLRWVLDLGLRSGPLGSGIGEHLRMLVPGVPAPWDLRWLLSFTFLQAVHYGIWLRLIPEEDRERETPRSFRASFRALHRDLGKWWLGAAVMVAVGLALAGLFDLARAHHGYLRLALFHGYLEVAALALLLLERRR